MHTHAYHAAGTSTVKGISRQELQHVQQLLAAYKASEGPAAAAAAAAASSSQSSQAAAAAAAAAPAAAGGGAAADAEGEGGASWAGEEYEPDSVSCMQRSYLKFMKRIARQPQQCARWGYVEEARGLMREGVSERGCGGGGWHLSRGLRMRKVGAIWKLGLKRGPVLIRGFLGRVSAVRKVGLSGRSSRG